MYDDKNMIKTLKKILLKFKKTTLIIIICLLAGGGYLGFQKLKNNTSQEIRYISSAATKGIITVSISGTGQVSTSDQVDIKPRVSGDIVLVNVQKGHEIKEGELIAQIDSRDASRKVNEALASLEIAILELEDMFQPIDSYTLLQAEHSLQDSKDSLSKLIFQQETDYQTALDTIQSSEESLKKAYEDSYNNITELFLDLPTIISGLNTILLGYEISNNETAVPGSNTNNYSLLNSINLSDEKERLDFREMILKSEEKYQTIKNIYENNFYNYKNITRYSDKKTIENMLDESITTLREISDSLKIQRNLIDYWIEYRTKNNARIFSMVSGYQSDLGNYISKVNNHLSSLLNIQKTIKNSKESIVAAERKQKEMEQNNPLALAQAERNIKEKEEKINDLKSGSSDIQIKNKKISIQQKQNSLTEAQQNLANYYVRAPFDGIIAEVNSKKGESVSSGSIIASVITDKQIAEISLNEIDATKIKIGQKAILNFDAIENLSITGQVVEIDTLGAVSSGVVSYGIKIAFDVQDERIKPAMSLSTNIIIESKQDVLSIPISAIKTSDGNSYVEVLINGQPERKIVTTGIANDTMIEIIKGINEGDQIITQTLTNNAGTSTTAGTNNDAMRGMMQLTNPGAGMRVR